MFYVAGTKAVLLKRNSKTIKTLHNQSHRLFRWRINNYQFGTNRGLYQIRVRT